MRLGAPANPWQARLRVWRNSIHVHLLALSVGVIASLTALSLAIFILADHPPEGPPLSVYEMSRLVRGMPLVGPPGKISFSRQQGAPPGAETELERLFSAQLANRLGLPSSDVRVLLAERSDGRAVRVAREIQLYGPDGAADPHAWGTFSIAVRDGNGWRIITRSALGRGYDWRLTGWYALGIGLLLILPLTLWFSRRFARPISALAASAQRMRADHAVEPIILAGPSEIRMAAQSLNEMQARISRYVRERTTLTAAVAHDLRAPLSRLRFHLASAPDPIRIAAEEEIHGMERLIEVILDFVQNDVRAPVHEPLDLALLVEGVADDLADLGQDVRIVEVQPITTMGDPIMLKRLFLNLIENAVKYGRAASIDISRDGGSAVVKVSDCGSGMTEEEIARAFEPFYRAEPSRNRDTGGAGLGLAIVKSAAEAHGGTVELANGQLGGLMAKVVLPIRAAAPAPS